MSLPLDSDTSEDSFSDSKIGRRMDLALCKYPYKTPPIQNLIVSYVLFC